MATQDMDLETFIDKLVSQKREYEGLEPGVIVQIKLDLLERVEDRINAMIVSNIPQNLGDQFSEIAESGSDEEVRAFCAKAIPDLAEKIASELIVLKKYILDNI